MTDRATEVALFRYALIREAADPALSTRQRGRLVRQLAEGTHVGPGGVEVRVGRSTADQWIRAWRAGGFEALKPKPCALSLKVPAEMLDMAEAAKHVKAAAGMCPSLAAKQVTPHVLRHTAAMRLLHAGVDTSVIALWLGHESVETTQIYVHADLTLKERALARTTPIDTEPGRYRPGDELLAFLESL